MTQNFLGCDREQAMLMPPSLREWLPPDHLVWFVLDAVDEMDLAAFYLSYRQDGWGRAAHDPAMMVALLVYAYAVGERSARGVERRCREDVAFRVITANQVPDHATIARFRVRHQDALAGLFGEVLRLCAKAGAVSVGVIAVDGTRVKANAADRANFTYEQLAREILAEADAIDAPKTSSSVSAAAMSCRPSWPIRTRAAGGCGRPSGAWTPTGRPSSRRWRTGRSPRPSTRPGRGGPRSARRRSRGRSRPRPRAASTLPTPTRDRSRRRAGSCRATPPRPSRRPSRS